MNRVEIGVVEGPADVAARLALRWDAFVREQRAPEADEIDGEDAACAQVLARVSGEPAEAAGLRRLGRTLKIQRVCVAERFRGRGLGADIVRFRVDRAREAGASTRR
ncbi:MAG: GNAT family N-acetyltransferase [Pseudomonadota bacterium]